MYQSSRSKTYSKVGVSATTTDVINVYDEAHFVLLEAYFRGRVGREEFKMSLKDYTRDTTLKGFNFLKIDHYTGNTRNFYSKYSGFIGILPYMHKEDDKENNFLYTLEKKGMITHQTVSFYVNDAQGDKKSTIKFGSYDQSGLKPGHHMKLIRTASTKTWDLKADVIQVGKEKLVSKAFIRFEP